jgi:hypothetical protein
MEEGRWESNKGGKYDQSIIYTLWKFCKQTPFFVKLIYTTKKDCYTNKYGGGWAGDVA